MDELDREILAILRRDARTPYTEIAEAVSTSEGTIRNRVDGMVENGIIERFTVSSRTGNVKAMIEIAVDVAVDTNQIAEEMATWRAVDFVWQVSGEEDLVMIVDAADTNRINELITKARELDEVVRTKTRLILDERLGAEKPDGIRREL